MKKILTLVMLLSVALTGFAQSTKYNFQETQARLLDVTAEAYVKPMKVSLKFKPVTGGTNGRFQKTYHLNMDEAVAMKDYANIRSYAVFRACVDNDCDVILAGTFNIHNNGAGVDVTIRGFAADFVDWQEVQPTDYEWIRLKYNIDRPESAKTSTVRK